MKKNMWIALVAMLSLSLVLASCDKDKKKVKDQDTTEVKKLDVQPAGDITLQVGAETAIEAQVEPATATVSFKIGDEAIATLKAEGKKATVKAVKSGETTVTVSAGKLSKTVKVIVKDDSQGNTIGEASKKELPYFGSNEQELLAHEQASGRELKKAKLETFGGGEIEFFASKDCAAFKTIVYGVNYGDQANPVLGVFAGVKEEAAIKLLLDNGFEKKVLDGGTVAYINEQAAFLVSLLKDGSKEQEAEFQKYGSDACMIVLFNTGRSTTAAQLRALKAARR